LGACVRFSKGGKELRERRRTKAESESEFLALVEKITSDFRAQMFVLPLDSQPPAPWRNSLAAHVVLCPPASAED
jgi:hypothetical protein